MKKNPPENKPTQWEICQPSDVFSKNPVKIKIPLGLLQRGVLLAYINFNAFKYRVLLTVGDYSESLIPKKQNTIQYYC